MHLAHVPTKAGAKDCLFTIGALASRPLVAFAQRFDSKPSGTTSTFGATNSSHWGGVGLGGGGNRGGRREGAMAERSWGPRWKNDISELTFEGVVGQSQIGTVTAALCRACQEQTLLRFEICGTSNLNLHIRSTI